MIKNIEFANQLIGEFGKINLIVGKNGVGKSELLWRINNCIQTTTTVFLGKIPVCQPIQYNEWGKPYLPNDFRFHCTVGATYLKTKILTAEQPERGLHPETIRNLVYKTVDSLFSNKLCEIQLFIETHSLDLIREFTQAVTERGFANHYLKLFRLYSKNNELRFIDADLEVLQISAARGGELR